MASSIIELAPVQVERADHTPLELPTAWGPDQVAVLVARAWAPRLAEEGAEYYFVSCGNTGDLPRWLEYTGIPPDRAVLDQANAVYDAMRTRRGVARTFVHPYMWLVLPFKLGARGTLGSLGRAMRAWSAKTPEKSLHNFLQGGTFVFRGPRLVWSHRCATPGDDPKLDQVVDAVRAAKRR
ncbi:hypothetical protein HYH03_002447 [Edaphochlamys debaryana]|uniref:Uncharacterized protein n=1 Tax=Edaphochlamys debaryana TaxID=47281 RepID=A0A835YAR4_9CHLO|nr:hypothetical protein HYH03_002447 [Edaphochlamys debaryana]|eukprot:KAG2499500.1 hypothetical protein HYH03_002447 [Edaphochlamys debaryana]